MLNSYEITLPACMNHYTLSVPTATLISTLSSSQDIWLSDVVFYYGYLPNDFRRALLLLHCHRYYHKIVPIKPPWRSWILIPPGTWRNNDVIMTSKRRRDVVFKGGFRGGRTGRAPPLKFFQIRFFLLQVREGGLRHKYCTKKRTFEIYIYYKNVIVF